MLTAAGLTLAIPVASVEGQVDPASSPTALVRRAIDALGGAVEASFPPADRSIVMGHFARWLEDRGVEVDRIYGTHIRGFATWQHVERLLDDPAASRSALVPTVPAAGARRR